MKEEKPLRVSVEHFDTKHIVEMPHDVNFNEFMDNVRALCRSLWLEETVCKYFDE